MMKNNSNTNGKPGKRPAFHHSKNSRGMKLLWHPSTVIMTGKFAGKSFGYVLERFGKKAFPELLQYYRISSKIMAEYHCNLKPHKDNSQKTVSELNKTVVYVNDEDYQLTANVADQTATEVYPTNATNTTDHVMDDDNKWTSSCSDYENNVLYDPEDDQPDTDEDRAMMAKGGPHRYWDGESFHSGTANYY